ncbi:hypothetical protein B7P34_17890 [Streptosporangium nondiastaticum]|uniref:Uncharacterized protein n=1 Tax=Streptosporangium nondiastaticum TaxID=35764 RepID=A0A9X7PGS0_9ACTN|nr:hypothetical protein B7P34_17890 [Streptosporangium nondiastaticum]
MHPLPLARRSAILVAAATLAALAPGTARADSPAPAPIKNEGAGWYLDSGGDTSSAKAPSYTTKYTGEPASAPGNLKWSYDASTKLIKNEANGWYLGSGGDSSSDKAPAYTTKYTGDPASAPPQLKWSYDASTKLVKNEGNGWYLGSSGDDYGKAPAYTTKYTGSPASAPAPLKWSISS